MRVIGANSESQKVAPLPGQRKAALLAFQKVFATCNIAINTARSQAPGSKRNFQILVREIPQQGKSITFQPLDQKIPSVDLNKFLGEGYRFIHGSSNLTHTVNKTVALPTDRKYSATFPYDALHETSHSRREGSERFVDNSDYMKAIQKRFADPEGSSATILGIVESISPAGFIAQERRAAIIALLRGEMSPADYLSAEDRLTAQSEHTSWRFAEEQTLAMECQGYAFCFPPEERSAYAQNCLMGSDLGTLLAQITRGDSPQKIREYKPVYVMDAAYTERVKTLVAQIAAVV